MNLILLFDEDFIAPDRVLLRDHRLRHVRDVHKASLGDRLRIGKLNGLIGHGQVRVLNENGLELDIVLDTSAPAPLPITLILALPRPKMLRRLVRLCAEFGVKELHFIHSYRVEKSYWQSPMLTSEHIRGYLLEGLEQARDTVLPHVHLHRRFKPFVEDVLPGLAPQSLRLLAHPGGGDHCPIALNKPTTVVIGPEGGFIPYEVEKLKSAGFSQIQLGERIYRVDNVVPLLLGRLFS